MSSMMAKAKEIFSRLRTKRKVFLKKKKITIYFKFQNPEMKKKKRGFFFFSIGTCRGV